MGSWRTWGNGQAARTRTGESSRLRATNTPGAPRSPGPSSISAPRRTSSRSTMETCSPRSCVCKKVVESRSSCPLRPTDTCPSWAGMSRSRPSWGSASRATAVDSDGDLAAFGSRNAPSVQVWSADYGYPGDGAYLEFHRKHGRDGLRYWRVTDRRIPLAEKVPYDPMAAKERAEAHAEHFASLVIDRLREYREATGRTGV